MAPIRPTWPASPSAHGINELDWEVGEKGLGRFEMHNDAVFHGADDLKIAESPLGQGTCLIDGHARLSVGSGISISGNGGIEQSMVIGGDALVESGNSMGAGNPQGHTDEGYLTLAFGNSLSKLTIQDNGVLNIRRLTAREGQSTLIVKDHGQFHIFDVLNGKGGSPADRPAETGPNSTFASAAAADTNLVSVLTLQDDAQMTVNSDPASGPTKGLAISGQRDSGNAGGNARMVIRDRASFRVEQDLMIGTGASPETSNGTLEVVGPAAQISVGGNLDMAVDLEGNIAAVDADGNPAPGKATLSAVLTGPARSLHSERHRDRPHCPGRSTSGWRFYPVGRRNLHLDQSRDDRWEVREHELLRRRHCPPVSRSQSSMRRTLCGSRWLGQSQGTQFVVSAQASRVAASTCLDGAQAFRRRR